MSGREKILVTGGAGFIGSAVIRYAIERTEHAVLNVDKLTYAANLSSLDSVAGSKRYSFQRADICDSAALDAIFAQHRPTAVMHLAAESHVDRSIDGPGDFIRSNIVGTYTLLESARKYWLSLNPVDKGRFRFHHISTDEVYGDLTDPFELFTENTSYAPSSPYAASKASSDHLVRSWGRTYGLPCIVSNCSNNYGPYQFPEKLIPHMILSALQGKALPIYGDGQQVRDWLYVDDHAAALLEVLSNGQTGSTYNIGGHNEQKNIDVVKSICEILEERAPDRKPPGLKHYAELIGFVKDRPGHDVRYAIDASKIERELGWKPAETFSTGLRKTVQWYLDNQHWWSKVLAGDYRMERLGK